LISKCAQTQQFETEFRRTRAASGQILYGRSVAIAYP